MPATLFVDPNVSSTKSIFGSLNSAVSAARSGDTIKVVAGTYREIVDVKTAGLTILGSQIRAGGEPTGASQIFPNIFGNAGFILDADNIAIRGFTIHNAPVAVSTSGSHSGYKITGNTLVDDQVGIHLNTSIAANAGMTSITSNVFTMDTQGPGVKDAILVDNGSARNVVISGNTFTDGPQLDACIDVNPLLARNIQIVKNSATTRNPTGLG